MSVMKMLLGKDSAYKSPKRHKDDFYSTTDECIPSLLALENHTFEGESIGEPCCGDGAISRILERRGYEVASSDLVDRNYGTSGVNFLSDPPIAQYGAIITNPPFKLAEPFIRRAFEIGVTKMALLLKSDFYSASTRIPLFEEFKPTIKYEMTWRPDFRRMKSPPMNCAWFVWHQPCADRCEVKLMERVNPTFADLGIYPEDF